MAATTQCRDEGSMLKVQGLRVQGLGFFRIHE